MRFGGMEMARIEAEQHLARDGVAQVELVRADGVALRANAEQLAFDGVEVVARVELFGQNLIQRGRAAVRAEACGRRACPCSRRGSRCWSRRACPGLAPKSAPILRQAMQCSIQNWRMPASAMRRVKPSAALGCEKQGRVEVQAVAVALWPNRSSS